MKLLSIVIPSYNSEAYLAKAVESLLPGGEQVEILIVNDGSSDGTASLADGYQRRFPGQVRAIHKENGGHGDAVMAGLQAATGLYFKVVDSDDWVDQQAYSLLLKSLQGLSKQDQQVDLFISNYIYDKVGVRHKKVVSFENALPQGRVFGWADTKRFKLGQYILMHAVIYRTQVLRESGLLLPKHTFYVDSLYVYIPLPKVQKLYYLNVDFYHYFIGREDQSVQVDIMIKRLDQQLRVNRLMSEGVNLASVPDPSLQKYMRNYLEIITTVSTVLGVLAKSPKAREQTRALWQHLKENTPGNFRLIRHRPLSLACRLPGPLGRALVTLAYRISRHWYGFQ